MLNDSSCTYFQLQFWRHWLSLQYLWSWFYGPKPKNLCFFSEFHVQPTVFVCWVIFRPLVNEMEKEMATHSSILAWRIPGMGAWWAATYGVAQSRTWLTQLSSSSSEWKKVKSELLHPSMGFSRQGYWSGLPCPSPGGSSQPRDWSLVSCIVGRCFYRLSHQGSPGFSD